MLTSDVPTKTSIQSVPGSRSNPVVRAGLPRSALTIRPDTVAGRSSAATAAAPGSSFQLSAPFSIHGSPSPLLRCRAPLPCEGRGAGVRALCRKEIVPTRSVVVGIVRPRHPVHDVAPARVVRSGVTAGQGPAFLRFRARTTLIPPLVVRIVRAGVPSLLEIHVAGCGRGVVALQCHLRAPPSLKTEVDVIESRFEVRGVLLHRNAVEPAGEPFLRRRVLADDVLLLDVFDHRIPGVGQPDFTRGQEIDALAIVFPDGAELTGPLLLDHEVDDLVELLMREIVGARDLHLPRCLQIAGGPAGGE